MCPTFKEARFGDFKISAVTIEQFPKVVRKLMGNMIVTHAYCSLTDMCMNYTAHSPLFPIMSEGISPNRYKLELVGGEWEVEDLGGIGFCRASLEKLREWNPVILRTKDAKDGPNGFSIFLPERDAEIAIDLTVDEAGTFCRAMCLALTAGESLDESVVTAGKAMAEFRYAMAHLKVGEPK